MEYLLRYTTFLNYKTHLNKESLKCALTARSWWLTPVILATQDVEIRGIRVQSQPRQIDHEILSQKYPRKNSGVAQVIECLPSKCEALSSNPSTKKKKKSVLSYHNGIKLEIK
jgi:hypothetical protein